MCRSTKSNVGKLVKNNVNNSIYHEIVALTYGILTYELFVPFDLCLPRPFFLSKLYTDSFNAKYLGCQLWIKILTITRTIILKFSVLGLGYPHWAQATRKKIVKNLIRSPQSTINSETSHRTFVLSLFIAEILFPQLMKPLCRRALCPSDIAAVGDVVNGAKINFSRPLKKDETFNELYMRVVMTI
uniref:Uncharacterized protein n=1 Tax=Strigamia maritima TaxID=126957 RepID=T1JLI9_STRMM